MRGARGDEEATTEERAEETEETCEAGRVANQKRAPRPALPAEAGADQQVARASDEENEDKDLPPVAVRA